MTRSAASPPQKKLLNAIGQTGKPVVAIFLTHPYPDHFGGLPILTKACPQAPRYALAQTRDSILDGANGYIEQSKQSLGEDFNEAIPLPTDIVQDGQEMTIAGMRLHVENAGTGEAVCMMMLYVPEEDTLFCADVVQHGMTAFLLESHLEEWLAQISKVAAGYGAVQKVYPGHGASGTASELFAYQLFYLKTFQQLCSEQKRSEGSMSPEGKAHIVESMNRAYPGFLPVAMIPNLLEMDLDAVAGQGQVAA